MVATAPICRRNTSRWSWCSSACGLSFVPPYPVVTAAAQTLDTHPASERIDWAPLTALAAVFLFQAAAMRPTAYAL